MPAPKKPAKSGYKVAADLIVVPTGKTVTHFSRGDILPGGVSEESIKHHLDLGFIEEVDVDSESSDSDEN